MVEVKLINGSKVVFSGGDMLVSMFENPDVHAVLMRFTHKSPLWRHAPTEWTEYKAQHEFFG